VKKFPPTLKFWRAGILPILIFFVAVFASLFLITQKTNAQENADCQNTFDKELYKCLVESTTCIDACVDKGRSVMSVSVDGAKVSLECQRNTCDPAKEACDDQVKANYKACKGEAKEAKIKENSLEESWTSIKFKDPKKVNDWIIENLGDYEIKPAPASETQVRDRTPQIKPDQLAKDSVLHQMIEEQLKAGAIATNYKDGVLIENLFEGKWIFISPNALVTYSPEIGRHSYSVQQGEVEIKEDVSNTDVETPNAAVKSKDTHYWVSYDSDKKETTVGVYKGKVEVKTPDGKTTTVSPKKDGKPGVAVVTQKLPVAKLAIGGLIPMVVIVGLFFVLKRKFAQNISGKKKR